MRYTPLYEQHVRDASAIINLKGVARAMHYRGHVAEHRAVREGVGLCDVSHMGELDFEGADALALIQKLITNDAGRLADNQALYSVMCDDDGTIIDDLVCFRLAADRFVWVVNVTKTDEDYQWALKHVHGLDVKVRDISTFYGTLDVKSWGFGLNDPLPNATVKTFNTDYAAGQNITYHNYNKWIKTLSPPTVTTINDQIDIKASNISNVVIDPIRARIDCNAVVNVQSDGPINVVIHGCLQGDIDLNDVLNCADVDAVKAAVGARQGDPNFNPRMDLDDNGVINALDVKLATAMLARTPGYGVYSCQ